jgi:hypothetical protein
MMKPENRVRRDSGQAAVESALVLPLMVFMILGTLQLFLMLQARILAQYAVARAGRAGSLNYGGCDAMTQAAIAALLPAIHPFLGTPGSAAADYQAALAPRMGNLFVSGQDWPMANDPQELIVWITREGTAFPVAAAAGLPGRFGDQGAEDDFDLLWDPADGSTQTPATLEIQMVFWYPLKVPFANWVVSEMMLASYGVQSYSADNPLMPVEQANWVKASGASGRGALVQDMYSTFGWLAGEGHYAAPIFTTYATRMMTPPRPDGHASNDCQTHP